MFNKNKLKYFEKFLENQKISYLNKTIKLCGYKKHKMKSVYNIKNTFGLKTMIDIGTIKEIVLSKEKHLDQKVYDTNKFNDAVNTYIVHYNVKQEIPKEKFSLYVKYIQENLVEFKNCNIAIFIYQDSIYAISEKVFNGVSTFVEDLKWTKPQ